MPQHMSTTLTLEALLNRPNALPTMSGTVTELLNEMNKEDPSPKRVAELVGRDPALLTRVLRLSNSSFFRASRQIGSAEEAVSLLGMTHVRSLVMAAALGETFKSVPGVNLQQFWRYSLRVAEISRSLADVVHTQAGSAHTAGLIHALGDLLMHIGMPDEVQRLDMLVPPLDLRRSVFEYQTFGFSFAEVGAGMLERWQFPATIVAALANQNAPFEGSTDDRLAGVLHLAAWRARAEEIQLDRSGMLATFPDMVGLALGVDLDSVLGKDPKDWSFSQALQLFIGD